MSANTIASRARCFQHGFSRSDCDDCRRARLIAYAEIRDLCKSVGLQYMRREKDRNGTLIKVPAMPKMHNIVAVSDSDLGDGTYLLWLANHAHEAKTLGVHHLFNGPQREQQFRSTLCGKRWVWHVGSTWASNTLADVREGGCSHCRVMLDRAMEAGRVSTVRLKVDWKTEAWPVIEAGAAGPSERPT